MTTVIGAINKAKARQADIHDAHIKGSIVAFDEKQAYQNILAGLLYDLELAVGLREVEQG